MITPLGDGIYYLNHNTYSGENVKPRHTLDNGHKERIYGKALGIRPKVSVYNFKNA